MKTTPAIVLLFLVTSFFAGCSNDSTSKNDDPGLEKVTAAEFLLESEPDSVMSVLAVREKAANDDPVVIKGRIGGSTDPWVDGVAAFTIVDSSLPACGDEEECTCKTPWDYCCETSDDIVRHSATVKFVDDSGRARRFEPQTVFNVKELQTVVIEGVAKRDDANNLTVLANKIYIEK